MQLPNVLRERLASEFRYAATRMSEVDSPPEKLFYFSVVYLETGRIINWHWDRELTLIWLITQQTHQHIAAKLQKMGQGDPIARLHDDYFDALTGATVELAEYVENDGSDLELLQLMETFSELIYLTTGNGYYLQQKGHISSM